MGSLHGCFGGPMTVQPMPLAMEVRDRFMEACANLPGQIKPAFHGTDAKNLDSICRLSLVVPGQGNHIRVANGSVHGRGIYTATLDHAGLSWGFSRGSRKPILVCAVLDDATDLETPRQLGFRYVTRESESVRHVGGAMVVFDPQRVAPLYVVTHKGKLPIRGSGTTPRFVSREPPRKRIIKAHVRIPLTGVVAFLSRRAACKRR